MNIHRNFGSIHSYRSDAHSDWTPATSYQIELAAERRRRRYYYVVGAIAIIGIVYGVVHNWIGGV